jgi:murein DD-endopeptidase MepM/ murein hydrolase activator NlpD
MLRSSLRGRMAVRIQRSRILFWAALTIVAAACIAGSYRTRYRAERKIAAEALAARSDAFRIQREAVLFTRRALSKGATFASALEREGVKPQIAAQVTASAQSVFNLRQVRAGHELAIGRSPLGELRDVRYRIDTDSVLSIDRDGDNFHSEIDAIPSHTESVGVSGTVHDSLFQAVTDAGEKPELAMRLAAIFGWDLDFYTDPRPGDSFRVVVEKKVLDNGTPFDYGRILAAEYVNAGQAYRAVLFHDPSGNPAYYAPDGKAMKKAFLHSPLKFGAPITSHFSYHRYHPILKIYRPHLGTDYGAPIGTPVQTIGGGRVVFAGRKGEDGKLVKIQHANGYVTFYMHLSRILVHTGERVEQGQRIGLVGMTGLATGPHLDFRIEQHGRFLNIEHLALPPANPVAKRDWTAFVAARDQEMAKIGSLPAGRTARASSTAPKTAGGQ